MGIKRKLVTPLNKLLYHFNMELIRPGVCEKSTGSYSQNHTRELTENGNTDLLQNQVGSLLDFTPESCRGEAWIPTMDDWWTLAKNNKEFCKVSLAILKDYGYLRVIADIHQHHPQAILEFGQGFCLYLWEECKKLDVEYWAVDNFSGVDYYPQEVREEYENHTRDYKKSHLLDGLIGDVDNFEGKIPENHFDIICSFSVLEHIQPADMPNVLKHCHHLLRSGGCLTGTFDIPVLDTSLVIQFIRALLDHGFEIHITDETREALLDYKAMNWERLILENPTSVMLGYQHAEGDDRLYSGHWATLFFRAYKV